MLCLLKSKKKKRFRKIGKSFVFNPDFDGNLIALYDGDTLTGDPVNTWSDSSGNGHNLTLYNSPTIITPGVNGHDTLRFNGTNQYADVNTPAKTQPLTYYIAFNLIVFGTSKVVFDGFNNNTNRLRTFISPQITFYCGNDIILNPFTSGTFEIITCIANGVNSVIRWNLNSPITGNAGANNSTGICIGAIGGGYANWSNIEVAYFISRNGADDTTKQNYIINALKSRFGI